MTNKKLKVGDWVTIDSCKVAHNGYENEEIIEYLYNHPDERYQIIACVAEGVEYPWIVDHDVLGGTSFDDSELIKVGESEKKRREPEVVHDFTTDWEKMYDFFKITKREFLESYSYITEEEYNLTAMNTVGYVPDMDAIPIRGHKVNLVLACPVCGSEGFLDCKCETGYKCLACGEIIELTEMTTHSHDL